MFGDNLKRYRIKNGLSQSDLAEKLFVSRQCISKWEKGVTQPDIETLRMISELFGVSVDCLIGNEFFDSSNRFDKYNRAMLLANLLVGLFCFISFLVLWRFLPDTIPAHWTNGVLDRYGKRNEVFLNYITIAVFIMLSVFVLFSFKRNSSHASKSLLIGCVVAHSILIAFQLVNFIFMSILYREYITNILSFISCLSVDLIFCLSIAMHPKFCKSNNFFGIETSITLKDPQIREKTNALASCLFSGFSILIFCFIFIFQMSFSYLFPLLYIIPTIICVVYAKILSRKFRDDTHT